MSRIALPSDSGSPEVPVVALRDLVPWTVLVGALLIALLFVVGADQGLAAVVSGEQLHEFLHDARHLLGFPCH